MLSDIFIFNEPVSTTQFICAMAILAICVAVGYAKIRLSVKKIKEITLETVRIEQH